MRCASPVKARACCMSAYVSIRPHTSAYVSIHPQMRGASPVGARACCRARRQHTSAYVSIRPHTSAYITSRGSCLLSSTAPITVVMHGCRRLDTSRISATAYVSIRQHMSAYVRIRRDAWVPQARRQPHRCPALAACQYLYFCTK